MRTGFRRGMSGSRASQAWLALGISALGVRTLRRLARTDPEVVYRTEVHAGDRFEISSRRN
jgi:type IV secretory pathway TrbD component